MNLTADSPSFEAAAHPHTTQNSKPTTIDSMAKYPTGGGRQAVADSQYWISVKFNSW